MLALTSSSLVRRHRCPDGRNPGYGHPGEPRLGQRQERIEIPIGMIAAASRAGAVRVML